jgi:hypothetical protein
VTDDELRGIQTAHPGDTERLHEYWVHGKGAAQIGWGAAGDFARCTALLEEHAHFTPEQAHGYCNLAHKAALGFYPATHAKMEGKHRSLPELPKMDFSMFDARTQVAGGPMADAEMEQHLQELLAGMTDQEISDLADLGNACAQEMGATD